MSKQELKEMMSRLENPFPLPCEIFMVVSDGPCGLNLFDAFYSKEKAEEHRDEQNKTRSGWDKTYIWTVPVKD